jgi:hypothetical protein
VVNKNLLHEVDRKVVGREVTNDELIAEMNDVIFFEINELREMKIELVIK